MVIRGLTSQTKNYYLPETDVPTSAIQDLNGLQIWHDIPWNDIYSTGWQTKKDNTWGQENKMLLKPDPEYFAPGDIIRTNVLPSINPNDPIYKYSSEEHKVVIY